VAAYDVVFFSPYLGPLLRARSGMDGGGSTGGAETQVYLVASQLARRGHRIAIAAFGPGLPATLDGIAIISLPARPTGGRIAVLTWKARLLATLVRRLDGSVLVQRAAGTATALVGAIARLRRRRFVYSSANVIDFDFDRLERRARAAWLFRLGVRLAHVVVVQSAEQVDLCRRAFGRSGELIASIAEPAAPRAADPEAFLWVGRLAPYKRPGALLDLAARLPSARFWMIGITSPLAPGLAEEIERRAEALDNVELLAPRPRSELAELVDRAVAMVNTSDFEGMPNVFLEGWTRGVPALALTHDPDGVVTRHGLGWFADGDVDRFAAGAEEAWRTRADQTELAARCRDYAVRRHGPDAVADAWERILFGRTTQASTEQPRREAAGPV
jgi:glycosyltransferase involved in cell wall biosynthesis